MGMLAAFSAPTLLAITPQTDAPTPPPSPAGGAPLSLGTGQQPATPVAELPPEAKNPAVENAVVKVFATVRYPDLARPWTNQAPQEVSGSGVIIEGRRILTNAHVVLYAGQVQVQANGNGDRLAARVEAIGPGIDLAVLRLEGDDEERFFGAHPPLARAAALPSVRDAVLAYGFPTGGSNLSITKGIVSRVEFTPYNYGVSGLRIQIDAAINSGNSGGPVVQGEKMIGLAFSHLVGGGAQNIGYIIPNEEVDRFLEGAARGRPEDKPAMFDTLQTLDNPALRASLKLDPAVQGIVIHQPFSAAPDYPLKEWDVLTRVGDTPVDNQGMVRAGPDGSLRVLFHYLLPRVVNPEGRVPLTVVRAGQELKVEVPVSPRRALVMPFLEGTYPSYFICGPLVFEEATADFVQALSRGGPGAGAAGAGVLLTLNYVNSPLLRRLGDKPAFEGERLVMVPGPFFPHRLASGYSNPAPQTVKAVNGTTIRNLAHLVEVVRDASGEFLAVEFATRGAGETLVFPRAQLLAATEGILTDNGVRAQGSPDVLAVWNTKKGGGGGSGNP